uniref:Uncharacterized protein n=1 Tax=Mammaliicoccus phage MSShimriz1 TaxID=3230127 RepID=A0AAU8GV44_9VIRU
MFNTQTNVVIVLFSPLHYIIYHNFCSIFIIVL